MSNRLIIYLNKYVNKKVRLPWRPSRGVAPEVNLRNPLHGGNKAYMEAIHTGFETQSKRHQEFKIRASVAPQKGLTSSKKVRKKSNRT